MRRLAVCSSLALLVAADSSGQQLTSRFEGPAVAADATVPTPPTTFVAIQPCRLADTRGIGGFTGPFGPPKLLALTERVFPVAGYCHIPTTALAVSANLTATEGEDRGWIAVWPEGAPRPSPLVSSINFMPGVNVANAVVAPLGTNGGITLYPRVGTHVVIDVNGYYRGPNPSALATCRLVGNFYWCYNPAACGQPCNDVCASLGFSMMPGDADWFAAQDSVAECQAISQAFGLGTAVNFDAWNMACVEDTGGSHTAPGGLIAPLFCSSNPACPAKHRTNMDWSGLACSATSMRSICPCG